jgi:acyl-CoA synthetase
MTGVSTTRPDWGLRATPPELERRWRAAGWWDDATLGQLLDTGLQRHGQLPCRIHSRLRPWSGTLGEVRERARRVAGGLRDRGIRPGDAVAFQLPNWEEAAVTFYAACFLGAVVVPIVHFYGAKEVGYILRRTDVRALVTADRFGHLDHLATLEQLRPDLPGLELVAVVGDPGGSGLPFDDLAAADPLDEPVAVDPAAPALVAYTSGTTADPKGVVHTHRSAGSEVRQLAAVQHPATPPTLVGAPVGHAIGLLAALLLPVQQGRPVHLIDVWDPGAVLAAMVEHGLTAGSGATYFLISLLDHPDLTDAHLALMPYIGLGGSAVPVAVGERATRLGISLVRLYGSTEHPSTTGSTHDDPLEKRLRTDGRPLPGAEVRIDGPPGEPGEILSRGPDCFAGYTDPALTAAAFDDDGWFHTGDVGVLDADGYLTVTDRLKDVIIRGGENVSPAEVEEELLRVPGVVEAAVVAAPDRRLGERACAFVRVAPGATPPTLDAVRGALEAAGLARQKWPEQLRMVADLPRTASGKVQKFVLREQLRDEARE